MGKLAWCVQQERGIELIEPNKNLSRSYLLEAENTIEAMMTNRGKWKVIIAYYACYNALYALLMHAGIKSEIHECSLELMRHIPQFTPSEAGFVESLKSDRIDAQYYLKERELRDEQQVKAFVFKCKQVLPDLDIAGLRSVVSNETKK